MNLLRLAIGILSANNNNSSQGTDRFVKSESREGEESASRVCSVAVALRVHIARNQNVASMFARLGVE